MVRLPDGVRRDPEDAVFALCFAATIVFAVLGWWSVATTVFALGIAGAIVADTLWPGGLGEPTHDDETTAANDAATAGPAADESTADALDTLRDRYARDDLGDEEFERKLEALLETETPDDARRRVERDAESTEQTAASTERIREN